MTKSDLPGIFTHSLEMHEQAETGLMLAELVGGREKFGRYQTRHEALGVILEEFDEFKAEIYSNNTAAAVKEARQVAATALRFCFEFGATGGVD